MRRHAPGAEAPQGTYLSLRRLAVFEVPESGGRLPAAGPGSWIRLPAAIACAACALAGLAYLLVLPAYWTFLVVRFVAVETVLAARAAADRLHRRGAGGAAR